MAAQTTLKTGKQLRMEWLSLRPRIAQRARSGHSRADACFFYYARYNRFHILCSFYVLFDKRDDVKERTSICKIPNRVKINLFSDLMYKRKGKNKIPQEPKHGNMIDQAKWG